MRILPLCRRLLTTAAVLSSSKITVRSLSNMISSKYRVRKAEKNDLIHIHGLIKDSFAAMNEYFTDPAMQTMMAKAAESMCEGELSAEQFEKTYFSSFGNHFWVIEESSNKGVYGCVGIKRHTADSAELVRMAVNPAIRGHGLGNLLVQELDKYCAETGVLQVTLSTANPRAGNFYKKCGFVDLAPVDSRVLRMVKYLGERIIRRVAVVGGTHGNERIGVELVRQWTNDWSAVERSTFKTSVLLGNPSAVDANTRYVEVDMNRQFSSKDMDSWKTSPLDSAEVLRAKELNELLGPKGAINSPFGSDFVIDLHSSVSNVGLVAMINGADKDCHALRLSQYLLEERKTDFPSLKITNSKEDKSGAFNVDSITPYGIAFEVGPIVHGTLSVELLEQTRQLVFATLDFLEAQNKRLLHAAAVDAECEKSTSVESTEPGVLLSQGREIVLASNSATTALIKKTPPFKEIDCYVEVSKVLYPGEESDVSPKIGSYPTSSVVHPALEGKDWTEIEDGNAAFMSTDGSKTSIPFKRPVIPPGHFQPPGPPETPPTLYPVFINEAAYQKSGVAFAVYKKISKTVF